MGTNCPSKGGIFYYNLMLILKEEKIVSHGIVKYEINGYLIYSQYSGSYYKKMVNLSGNDTINSYTVLSDTFSWHLENNLTNEHNST